MRTVTREASKYGNERVYTLLDTIYKNDEDNHIYYQQLEGDEREEVMVELEELILPYADKSLVKYKELRAVVKMLSDELVKIESDCNEAIADHLSKQNLEVEDFSWSLALGMKTQEDAHLVFSMTMYEIASSVGLPPPK